MSAAILEAFKRLKSSTYCKNCTDTEAKWMYRSCGHIFCFACQEGEECVKCGAKDKTSISSDPMQQQIFGAITALTLEEVNNWQTHPDLLDKLRSRQEGKETSPNQAVQVATTRSESDKASPLKVEVRSTRRGRKPKTSQSSEHILEAPSLFSPPRMPANQPDSETPRRSTRTSSSKLVDQSLLKTPRRKAKVSPPAMPATLSKTPRRRTKQISPSLTVDQVVLKTPLGNVKERPPQTSDHHSDENVPKHRRGRKAKVAITDSPILPQRSSIRLACTVAKNEVTLSPEIPVAAASQSLTLSPQKLRTPSRTLLMSPNGSISSSIKLSSPMTPKTKKNHKGETPLHLACQKGNVSDVRQLLDSGADPNAQDNNSWTPLHDAVQTNSVPIVQLLIDAGVVIDAPGGNNETALHSAVKFGCLDVAKLLLSNGADPMALDLFGNTPRSLAATRDVSWIELVAGDKVTMPLKLAAVVEPRLYEVNLTADQKSLARQFAAQFHLKIEIKNCYIATHFIISDDFKTETFSWALFRAVAKGAFIVKSSWLKSCIEENELVDLSDYEVKPAWLPGLEAAQMNRLLLRPGLFSGCHVVIGGPNTPSYTFEGEKLNLNDVRTLVEWANGFITKKSPNPDAVDLVRTVPYHAQESNLYNKCCYLVINLPGVWEPQPAYNMEHFKTLSFSWLMDSLSNFSFQ